MSEAKRYEATRSDKFVHTTDGGWVAHTQAGYAERIARLLNAEAEVVRALRGASALIGAVADTDDATESDRRTLRLVRSALSALGEE